MCFLRGSDLLREVWGSSLLPLLLLLPEPPEFAVPVDAALLDPLVDDPLIDDPLVDDPLVDDPLVDDPLVDDADATAFRVVVTTGLISVFF